MTHQGGDSASPNPWDRWVPGLRDVPGDGIER